MNRKIIDHIQSEVVALARKKYPNNERLQWIYVYGFVTAQLALAVEHDNHVIYRFNAAVRKTRNNN